MLCGLCVADSETNVIGVLVLLLMQHAHFSDNVTDRTTVGMYMQVPVCLWHMFG
jgi:hypothetical protein